jgi:hypothetical protein
MTESTSWLEYSAGTCETSQVLFMNGGRYLRHNLNDNTLQMVDSKENATTFYLNESCSPADQRLSYRLVRDANNDSIEYKFLGKPEIAKQITMVLCSPKENSNFHIKYDFNDEGNLDSVSFLSESNDSIYAFDNYGDGRVVWWNTELIKGWGVQVQTKENQKFKVIFTK